MRLIDADELLKKMDLDWYFQSCIKCAKTIDTIIHAHIITNWLGDSRCSHCGQNYIDINSKYCSECGARFDEPQVDEGRFGGD